MSSLAAVGAFPPEVVVIGAGPAGSVAARELARAGLDTLLVDRRRFPRNKVCGGCLNAHSLALLRLLGLGAVVDGVPGRAFSSLQLRTAGGRELLLPLPEGKAVTRERLDHALVGAAVAAGATFLGGVSASVRAGDPNRPDRRQVRLRADAAPEVTVCARVVVAADGLGHPSLAAAPEFSPVVSRRSRIGAGAVVEAGGGDYQAGTIHMAVDAAGYVGVVEVDGGRLDVAAALDAAYVKGEGRPGAAAGRILDRAGFPAPDSLSEADWRGAGPLTRRLRRPSSWRVFVIGDAAGYVEPFTGEGIAWALGDAAAIPDFVRRGVADWSRHLEDDWIANRRRRVGPGHRLCRAITTGLRSGAATRAGLGVLECFPRLAGKGFRRFLSIRSSMEEANR